MCKSEGFADAKVLKSLAIAGTGTYRESRDKQLQRTSRKTNNRRYGLGESDLEMSLVKKILQIVSNVVSLIPFCWLTRWNQPSFSIFQNLVQGTVDSAITWIGHSSADDNATWMF